MSLNYFPGHYFPNLRRAKRSPAKPRVEPQQPVQSQLPAPGIANSRVRRALKKGAVPARINGSLYDRILNRPLPVSSRGDDLERRAERLTSGVQNGTQAGTGTINRLTTAPGQRLPVSQQKQLEARLNHPLDDVRIHKDRESGQAAALLGAEAFTHGRDIFLSDRAHATDNTLLAHEAAHAIQNQDAIQRREATWFERRAWLGFFDHYLPRKFLNNYMDDTGNPITLTRQEMEDTNAVNVDIRRSADFQQTLSLLKAVGGGSVSISCTALAGALTNGTLGNFTVRYSGTLSVNAKTGNWHFIGTITFIDFWDFNTGGGNRPPIAEAKVVVANALLPGSPFRIDSVAVAAYQTQSDTEIQWGAAAPAHVPDNLRRGALDIGTGADIVSGSPDVGAEVGAQANADL